MIDFLLSNYSLITKSVELFAFLAGFVMLKKFKHTPVVFFIFFLLYTIVVENVGSYMGSVFLEGGILENYTYLKKYPFHKNYWWFGIFWTIGSVLFWSYFYQKIITNTLYTKVLNVSTYIFILCVSVYTLFHINAFFNTVLIFNKLLGSIIILMAIVFYFLDVLQSDNILTFYKSIYFYISMALFLWWIITNPPYFYEQISVVNNTELRKILSLIRLFSNIFMYSTFGIALLLCKSEKPLYQ
ncbi:hypothetical protein [Formosa sp. S-31]|uniref:hypothetical protein n=1 Tax=Formosa sp. S-31 TaxID=2790949 RepID=UPI003EB6A6F9